jgi:iron-sulfur cluster repair protein YtfE (RIC family)
MKESNAPIEGLATELFRREHLEIKEILAQVGDLVGTLHVRGAEMRKTMGEVVSRLQREITPHAEWEERVLYPIVDRHAVSGSHRYTDTMRYEHTIIARQVDDLAAEARRPLPDARRFARHADQLLGLIAAHFEEEEEVLLGILDSTMTAEEFRRAVMLEEEHAGVAAGAGHTHHHDR